MLHYAWYAKADNTTWLWEKHKYGNFEAEACPPWTSNQGLFPHPPMPSELKAKVPP